MDAAGKNFFEEISLARTKEFGILEECNNLEKEKFRLFSRMILMENKVRKEGIDEQSKAFADRECQAGFLSKLLSDAWELYFFQSDAVRKWGTRYDRSEGIIGYQELYGDPYDWAKLYYSIAGNYDKLNFKI